MNDIATIDFAKLAELICEPDPQAREDFQLASTDEAKIDALADYGKDLVSRSPSRVEPIARAIEQVSAVLNYPLGIVEANYLYAAYHWVGGRLALAQEAAQKAYNLVGAVGEVHWHYHIASLLGGISSAQGDFDGALAYGLETLQLAEQMEEPSKVAVALLNLSIAQREAGTEQAKRDGKANLDRAFGLLESKKPSSNFAHICRELGAWYINNCDYDRAVEYLLLGLEIVRGLDNRLLASDFLTNLSVIELRRKDFESAEAYAAEAMEIRRSEGDEHSATGSLVNLGSAAVGLKKLQLAEARFREVLIRAEASGSKKMRLLGLFGLVECFEAMGDFRSALDFAHKANELESEIRESGFEERERRIRAQVETKLARLEAANEKRRRVELTRAQRLAQVGSFEWHPDQDNLTGEGEVCRLLGFQSDRLKLSLSEFLTRFSVDDEPTLEKMFLDAVECKIPVDVIARGGAEPGGGNRTLHLIGQWETDVVGSQYLACTLQDVSQQLEADEARRERDRLQGMLEMAGAFSHELNQPMQVILTTAELLQATCEPGTDIRMKADRLLSSVQRMNSIVQSLTRATTFKTREYVGQTRIVQLEPDFLTQAKIIAD